MGESQGEGFEYGYATLPKTISMAIEALRDEGETKLYVWCNSLSNLNRPPEQVTSYMKHYLRILDFAENPEETRIEVRGNWSLFPDNFYKLYQELQDKTKDHDGFDLIYFMNYSTVDDLARTIAKHKENTQVSFEDGTGTMEQILAQMDEPDNIDIILRTGGYHRTSGFLPIKSPNAELMFVDEYTPELSRAHILQAKKAYDSRVINYGL